MKRYILQAKVLVPLGASLILMAAISVFSYANHHNAISPSQQAFPDEQDLTFAIMVFLIVVGVIAISKQAKQSRVREFGSVFGFDPRPNEEESVPDPQKRVNRRIELLQRLAQDLFAEEVRLQNSEVAMVEQHISQLNELFEKKLGAKQKFWHACSVASAWGYSVPRSINESVS